MPRTETTRSEYERPGRCRARERASNQDLMNGIVNGANRKPHSSAVLSQLILPAAQLLMP